MKITEVDKIVDRCIIKGDQLVDELQILFNDMRANAISPKAVDRNIKIIEDALKKVRY